MGRKGHPGRFTPTWYRRIDRPARRLVGFDDRALLRLPRSLARRSLSPPDVTTHRGPTIVPTRSVRMGALALLVLGIISGAAVSLVVRSVGAEDGLSPAASSNDPPTSPVAVDSAQVAAAEAYLAKMQPIASEGGHVVQAVLKPAITELANPDGDHSRQAERASGWIASMTSVRERWAELDPPPALADAHELFLDGLDRYVAAADLLVRATTDDQHRATLVDEAIGLGTEGDQLYDEAAVLVQELLVAGGRDPVAWLPRP
jgi:hypothetical protein